jgi:hypothetical protein
MAVKIKCDLHPGCTATALIPVSDIAPTDTIEVPDGWKAEVVTMTDGSAYIRMLCPKHRDEA